MSSHEHNVTLVRVINSTANELYDACTEPQIVERWLHAKVVEADVRVNGHYRYEVVETDGRVRAFGGQYKVLDVGHRIVQTFGDPTLPPGTFTNEQIEIQFAPQGSLTKVTLIHAWNGYPLQPHERAAREARWKASIDRLALATELPSTLET